MARAALALCMLVLVGGCADNPYVIGSDLDAGGSVDGDAGIGECGDAHADALLCSGFEQEDVAADFGETVLMGGGMLERTDTRVHTGSGALHASSGAIESMAVVRASFPPLFAGELHVRAYLYVPLALPTETMNIFFLGAGPEIEPFIGFDFNLQDGAVQVFSPQNGRHTGELIIPRERWFCFRSRLAIADGDAGLVQVFVDDVLALEVTAIDTLPDDGVRQFRAGVDWSSEQAAFFEIYVDDLVLDTAEVECL